MTATTEQTGKQELAKAEPRQQQVVEYAPPNATIAVAREAYKLAPFYAQSNLVPKQFQDQPANCFIALQFAWRIDMDPFMVMQGMYVVHGRPGLEAKFVLALVNASRLFEDPLDFEFTGKKGTPEWTCTASAKRSKTGKLCTLDFAYGTAEAEGWVKKEGSKWRTMPEQMMRYRAAAFFARIYCPEVIMGMQTVDELQDAGETRPTFDTLPAGRSSFRPEKMQAVVNGEATEVRDSEAAPDPETSQTPAPDPETPPEARAEDPLFSAKGGRRRATVHDLPD